MQQQDASKAAALEATTVVAGWPTAITPAGRTGITSLTAAPQQGLWMAEEQVAVAEAAAAAAAITTATAAAAAGAVCQAGRVTVARAAAEEQQRVAATGIHVGLVAQTGEGTGGAISSRYNKKLLAAQAAKLAALRLTWY
jgi:hypothetical protein